MKTDARKQYEADWKRKRTQDLKARGICIQCGKVPRVEDSAQYCAQCRERRRELERQHQKKKRQEKRKTVVEHYGSVCACCGESEPDFLAIDHINGGGGKHIKSLPSWVTLEDWLIENDLPEGFQILCHNCNMSKHKNGGKCIHQIRGLTNQD